MSNLTAPLRFHRSQYVKSAGLLGEIFRSLPGLTQLVWLSPAAHLSGRSYCDEFELYFVDSPHSWTVEEFVVGSSTRRLLDNLYAYPLQDWE